MSHFTHRLQQWLAGLRAPMPAATHFDAMSLNDWADLPVYHPLCD